MKHIELVLIVSGCFLIALSSGCASKINQSPEVKNSNSSQYISDLSDEWGKGTKQEDGTTVYKRVFEVPASHWEPNDISNYFAEFEYTTLHIGEGKNGQYFHLSLCQPGYAPEPFNMGKKISFRRDENMNITEIGLRLCKNYYVDLNGDGRLDLLHDHQNNKSFIITKDKMIRVNKKRTKDQDVQRSWGWGEDVSIYRFQDGEWIALGRPDNYMSYEDAIRILQEDPYNVRAMQIRKLAEREE